jgi:hypothetical protein
LENWKIAGDFGICEMGKQIKILPA